MSTDSSFPGVLGSGQYEIYIYALNDKTGRDGPTHVYSAYGYINADQEIALAPYPPILEADGFGSVELRLAKGAPPASAALPSNIIPEKMQCINETSTLMGAIAMPIGGNKVTPIPVNPLPPHNVTVQYLVPASGVTGVILYFSVLNYAASPQSMLVATSDPEIVNS